MKLSPKLKYTLAFWSITGPVLVPFLGLVLIAVVNPLWFRSEMLNWVERFARTLGEWRDEKFAELIVRECLGCCEQVISDPVPKSVDTWLNGGTQCIDEIKQHFGVEL